MLIRLFVHKKKPPLYIEVQLAFFYFVNKYINHQASHILPLVDETELSLIF